jgi:hypothetical protein
MAHLRVFRSQAFFHGNQPNPGKLAPHSHEGILFSHNTQAKGWRIYLQSSQCVIIAHDVRIIESASVSLSLDTAEDLSTLGGPSLSPAHPYSTVPLSHPGSPPQPISPSTLSTPSTPSMAIPPTTPIPALSPSTTTRLLAYERRSSPLP